MKRFLYFAYFIKIAKFKDILSKIKLVSQKEDITKLKIILDMIYSAFRFKSSFEDYFIFEFFNKTAEERKTYLTTGKAHEFHDLMNEKNKRYIFRQKHIFMSKYKEFTNRDYLYLTNNYDDFLEFISNKNFIVAKPDDGTTGKGIALYKLEDYTDKKVLWNELLKNQLNLIEELICQKEQLNRINPTSVNTIRIITVRNNDKTYILGALLRMSVGDFVDNLTNGGIVAPINIKTGVVKGPAVSKKLYESYYQKHPKTKEKIVGFNIPFWNEIKIMIDKASKIEKGIGTVGWDIAITENGPELIEGNDNWGKNMWQLGYQKGKMSLIEKYI